MKLLFFIPILAFAPTLLSVALIGTFWDIKDLAWLFPNKNAWQVYVGWTIILSVAISTNHFLNKKET